MEEKKQESCFFYGGRVGVGGGWRAVYSNFISLRGFLLNHISLVKARVCENVGAFKKKR